MPPLPGENWILKKASGLKKQWDGLTSAEQDYFRRHPAHILIVRESKEVAYDTTKRRFGHNGRNDDSDAFRHCFWSGYLAMKLGPDHAKEFTDAHENRLDNDPLEKRMDLHNNRMGIWFGRLPEMTREQLEGKCFEALQTGQLIRRPEHDGPTPPEGAARPAPGRPKPPPPALRPFPPRR